MSDIVYVYKHTADNGKELRHSLRSIHNLKDFTGKVYIVGDKEEWFSDKIIHLPTQYPHHSPYKDVENKVMQALRHPDISDDFILMNDDLFITEPTTLKVIHRGYIEEADRVSFHTTALKATGEYLKANGIEKPLNYSLHAPMLMNKANRLKVHYIINSSLSSGIPLLARTIYGNLFTYGGEPTEDLKTYDNILKQGAFISTSHYTSELTELFPDMSIYEQPRLTIYDDTETQWDRRYKLRGRVNGAKTYTAEILKHHLPAWQLPKDTTVSTTNLLNRITGVQLSDINIQYLHTYPLTDPLEQVKPIVEIIPNTVFIVSYRALHDVIQAAGYASIFIPMSIDVETIPQVDKTKDKKSIIYYGNVTKEKQPTYDTIRAFFIDKGWTFDTISEGRLNGGEKMTQQECLEIAGQYQYGVAVGRCYQELAAMGVKSIVAGNGIGGIVTTVKEHKSQIDTNYNARYFTYSDDLEVIYKAMGKIKPLYVTSQEAVKELRKGIERL